MQQALNLISTVNKIHVFTCKRPPSSAATKVRAIMTTPNPTAIYNKIISCSTSVVTNLRFVT